MEPTKDTTREILDHRPDLDAEILQNWAKGMAGCTLQSEQRVLRELLYTAKAGRPMPWESSSSHDLS